MTSTEPSASPNNDFDSPWKQVLEDYFEDFIAFFFPKIHRSIDWDRGYEFLDTQLQQIVREAETGKRFADKLAKVWQRSGKQTCVFVHIEIQSQRESNFAKRVFSYYYRLSDRFDEPIVSLAVLADADRRWRPSTHSKTLWGCSVSFTFPVVKLLDYRQQWANLEVSENPFAIVVMAHLKTQETHNNPRQRQATKLALARALLHKGYQRQTVINLLRFIDWIMALPSDLETQFWQDLNALQGENSMPYLLSLERLAMDRGREEGREEGRELLLRQLRRKLGTVPAPAEKMVRALKFDQLELLGELLLDAIAWPELLRRLLTNDTSSKTPDAPSDSPDAAIVNYPLLVQVLQACWGEIDEETQQRLGQLSSAQVEALMIRVLDGEAQTACLG